MVASSAPTLVLMCLPAQRPKAADPPARFIRQTIDELLKVVTPTGKELLAWSFAVFVFVLLLMALVTGMDFGLGKLVLWVFG